MINVNIYKEKLDIALQQKKFDNYKSAIKAELAKNNWQNSKFELDKLLSGIKTTEDFIKYQKALIKLFDDLYEVITAPGVDDFISWLLDITDNKNEANTKKLRAFLVEHFSEQNIRQAIESILSTKDSLNIEGSIFYTLLSEIKKVIKKECNDFLNKPEEFQNNIVEFLKLLTERLNEFDKSPELKYKELNDFYSSKQITNNINWYDELICQIITINQSLKSIDKREENFLGPAPGTKTLRRISDIKACIQILDNCDIANISDDDLKNLFHRFATESIKYEGGIKDNLDFYLENKWSEVEANYNIIYNFFNEKKIISFNSEWELYPKKEEIQALILNYNSIIKDNPLPLLQSQKSTLSIQQSLTKKVTAINEFNSSSERIKADILDLFEKSIVEYRDKNMPLLDSLVISNPLLSSLINDINQNIVGLKNGKESLNKTTDFLSYLINSFTYDLNSYIDISTLFTRALQESGKSKHLIWLESKLNGSEKGDLIDTDFINTDLIKDLVSIGLIKIYLEKQF